MTTYFKYAKKSNYKYKMFKLYPSINQTIKKNLFHTLSSYKTQIEVKYSKVVKYKIKGESIKAKTLLNPKDVRNGDALSKS